MKPKEINSDIEDIEDVLKKIETSYNIKFVNAEMSKLKTFGEIANHIISKIELQDNGDCTSQQAFYKLRSAIVSVTGISNNEITPTTRLNDLFPHNKRKVISLIEKELNLNLKAFYIPKKIIIFLISLLFISVIIIFFRWEYGLFGIIITIALMKLADRTTTSFFDQTVGELAKSMMYDNYIQSRRDPTSFNKAEIKKNLEAMFIKQLGLANEFDKLDDDTVFIN